MSNLTKSHSPTTSTAHSREQYEEKRRKKACRKQIKRRTEACRKQMKRRFIKHRKTHPNDPEMRQFAQSLLQTERAAVVKPNVPEAETTSDESVVGDNEMDTHETATEESHIDDNCDLLTDVGSVNDSDTDASDTNKQVTYICGNNDSENTNVNLYDDNEYEYAPFRDDSINSEYDEEEEDNHDVSHGESESSEGDGNCPDTSDDDNEKIFSIDQTNEELSSIVQFKHFVTNLHAILCMLAFAIRSRLTYTSIITLFKSLRAMTINSVFPMYISSLWKLLSRQDDYANTRHYYCRECKAYLGSGKKPQENCCCGKCGPGKENKTVSYFIALKVKPQLLQLFSNPAVIKTLEYRFTRKKRAPDKLEDIYDGIEYKKLCEPNGFLNNKYNFSFGLFTDGARVSVSSNASAWPVMLVIHELSPHARKKHMLLAGIWVDTFHPDLNCLLYPIMMELNVLYKEGITWKNPIDNELVVSKFITLVVTVDSGARWSFLNMTQYNGEFGCTFCYAKGTGMRGKRVYPQPLVPYECRTNDRIRRDMKEASETEVKVNGVKGFSAICILQYFDLGRGVIVDSMHNIYLGVAKRHAELLFRDAGSPWYIGEPNNLIEINKRIMSIRTPTAISRRPRPVETMPLWKASEWRNWLLFYAIPCLQDIVNDNNIKTLALLSRAAYIFNKDSISANEMITARRLLNSFITKYERTFGQENMSYNIHLLNHLPDSVANWGPFWTHSAFPYESWNKHLVDHVTSANSRALQIATRFLITRFVEKSMNDPEVHLETRKIVNDILNSGSKREKNIINFTLFRQMVFQAIKKINTRKPNEQEIEAIILADCDPLPLMVSFYDRVIINGVNYHRRSKKQTSYCNEYVYCEDSQQYGQIVEIIGFEKNNDGGTVWGLLVQTMTSNGNNPLDAEHIECLENK